MLASKRKHVGRNVTGRSGAPSPAAEACSHCALAARSECAPCLGVKGSG